MALPLAYNAGSIRARWPSALVAVLGIAGTVGVFVAMLAMANGFRATLVASGSPLNATVRRSGADTELMSILDVASVRVVGDGPGVARAGATAMVAPEVVVVGSFHVRGGPEDAMVQVRGTSAGVLEVRPHVRLAAGRFFRAGLPEIVAGRYAARDYTGLAVGDVLRFGGTAWTVVGTFDAGGSAFDSEIWCDGDVLNQVYQRPRGLYQAAVVRLESVDALDGLRRALSADPRLSVQVEREPDYYERLSHGGTTRIKVLGGLVSLVMALGAVFGALNTMYSAVAERAREIATLRALGFGEGSVVLSFVVESVIIALAGGALGALAVLPMNGLTTGTLNFQTFSHVAFAFRITPSLLAAGMGFAVLMGLLGGVPPAIRAARMGVASALRAL